VYILIATSLFSEDLPIIDSDSDLNCSAGVAESEHDSVGRISECESQPHVVDEPPKDPKSQMVSK